MCGVSQCPLDGAVHHPAPGVHAERLTSVDFDDAILSAFVGDAKQRQGKPLLVQSLEGLEVYRDASSGRFLDHVVGAPEAVLGERVGKTNEGECCSIWSELVAVRMVASACPLTVPSIVTP